MDAYQLIKEIAYFRVFWDSLYITMLPFLFYNNHTTGKWRIQIFNHDLPLLADVFFALSLCLVGFVLNARIMGSRGVGTVIFVDLCGVELFFAVSLSISGPDLVSLNLETMADCSIMFIFTWTLTHGTNFNIEIIGVFNQYIILVLFKFCESII